MSPELHTILIWIQIAAALVTVLLVSRVRAPYGRHNRVGWGPQLPARWGWIAMESPPILLFLWIYLRGPHAADVVPLVLLALWQLHYIHRAYVFPFRMRNSGKTMPVLVVLLAIAFNSLNATINATQLSRFGDYPAQWLLDPRLIVGAAIFLVGMGINLHADTVLLNLRRPGETGYKIPKGGLYRFISCPNYLGEILEWIGFAVATWSMAGLAFALYTIANVGPRALSHHRWYRETFPDYPKRRRALIPFVL